MEDIPLNQEPSGTGRTLLSPYEYFRYLQPENFMSEQGMEEFKAQWMDIERHDLDATTLRNILEAVVDCFENSPAIPKTQLRNFLAGHIGVWERAFKKVASQSSAFQLTSGLWADRRLKIEPGKDHLEMFYERACDPDGARRFSPYDLVAALHSFAVLGIEPGSQFMMEFERQFSAKLPQFLYADLANIMWSCAVLYNTTNKIRYMRFANMAYERISQVEIVDTGAQRMVATSCLRFGWESSCAFPPENHRTSHKESIFKSMLIQGGYRLYKGPYGYPFPHNPDAAVELSSPVIVEVDGASHFVYGFNHSANETRARRYDGGTYLQTTLVPKDMKVLRMPFFTMAALKNRDTRPAFLDSLFTQMEDKPAGRFVAMLGRDKMPVVRFIDSPELPTV